jgi:hypothetical protein
MKNTITAILFLSFVSCSNASVSVTCGGVNDTSALQSAINTAQASGDEVLLPASPCKILAPLTVTDRITIRGVGYQDDGGAGYAGSSPFNPGLKGSVIYPGAHDAFQITTNAAVLFEKFQIAYNQGAASGSGYAAIRASASSAANTRSVFRDITITAADYGLVLTNLLEFRIDNVNVLYGWNGGISVASPNYPSYGDSLITNCTMWGNGGSGGNQYSYHIGVFSGGGLRIVNNKLNVGDGQGGSGIFLDPNLSVAQTTEPIVIVGNSIEGQAVGINIANSNPANATLTEIVITGNQIWSGINAIRVNPNGAGKWFSGFTIAGNALMANGGMNKTIMYMDNAQIGVITGNQFALSGGGTGWGTNLGAHTTGINIQSNVYAPGVVPAVNGGVSNVVGGGSP